jgi:hypothetical protein
MTPEQLIFSGAKGIAAHPMAKARGLRGSFGQLVSAAATQRKVSLLTSGKSAG